MESTNSATEVTSYSHLGINEPPDFPRDSPYVLERTCVRSAYPSPSSHRNHPRCWNINQLSIDYAFRPRLRIRLTLRRKSLRRKPWAYGVRVFHPFYRYSCQHSHFRYLQQTYRFTFAGVRNAPLPRRHPRVSASAASVYRLAPLHLPRGPTRPVSYYAFFK